MTPAEWSALAQRALVAASVNGLAPKSARIAHGIPEGGDAYDLVVLVDAPPLTSQAFASARAALGADGIVAAVVASTSAVGLLASSAAVGATAYARAATWAAAARNGVVAPPVSAERLRALAELATAAGLALVEPDLEPARAASTAIDRAVLATIASGATARPLLFIPDARAPKKGRSKAKAERVLDGWIAQRAGGTLATARDTDLIARASAILSAASAPMRGKDLLREARAGASSSTADGPSLAASIFAAWVDGRVDVYVVDPA